MKFVIYCHTCVHNGKSYVGLTSKTLVSRWNGHVHLAFDERPRLKLRKFAFQSAIKKYGVTCWRHQVLQDDISTLEQACAAEVYWIKKLCTLLPSGYNETSGGRGVFLSEEGRERHRRATREALNRPDVRARYLEGIRRGHSTPEFLAKNRIAQRIAQSRCDVAERKRQAMKRFCAAEGWVSPTARPVEQLTKSGERIAIFGSAIDASRATGVNYTHLTEVARGLRKYSGGYIWRYLDIGEKHE